MKEINIKISDMECAACVATLDKALMELPGVAQAAVNYASASAQIVYDDEKLTLSNIVTKIKKTGFRVPEEEADLIPLTENLASIVGAMQTLRNVFGVSSVNRKDDGKITVGFWSVGLESGDLIAACREVGCEVKLGELRGGDEDQEIMKRMGLLKILITSAACTAPLLWEPAPKLQFLIGSVLQLGPARHFYKGAWRGIKNRNWGMDMLVSLSTTIIYLYSSYVALTAKSNFKLYFAADGILISLILFGKYMEQVAAGEAGSAIRKLIHLQPKTAMVLKDGEFVETDTDRITEHDVILIRPGERIPVDGVIIEGSCAVDESMMTGESLPVNKTEGDMLVCGSLNRSGSVRISASSLGKDSVLRQIIDIVRKAQTEKAPVQRYADKVAHWFVPGVIGAAALTFFGWYFIFKPYDLTKAVLSCCDVLTVACPCALGLAIPTGLMVGSGKAAESGILFKSGAALENVYKADTVVFDKTGTLTRGMPEVTEVYSLDGESREEIISLAAGLERLSEHPVSAAITEFAAMRYPHALPPAIESFNNIPGRGIAGISGGRQIICGNRAMLEEFGIDTQVLACIPDLRAEAQTEICVARDGKILGVIGIADRIKPNIADTIDTLKAMGKDVWLMTGDNSRTAKAIGKAAGIENVLSEVLPEEKSRRIDALRAEGKNVCMVGDGINDTPALASADCSVAMGTGSDIAIESAGIILPSGNIEKLPEMFDISNGTIQTVNSNLRWALFYNIISIPIAASGLLHPSICAAAMSMSSIGVMLRSLRLKKDKKKGGKSKWKKR